MNRLPALFLGLAGLFPTTAFAAECRLALVLALDVSGSVNAAEYRQQLDGLATALGSPRVRQAILSGDAPVELAAFEWSSRNHQFLIQPWITLDSHDAIDRATTRIQSYQKQRAGLKTALGTALLFAASLLDEKPSCWQHTVDVSGDGKNNIGVGPEQVYTLDAFSRTTVNALVVGDPGSGREAGEPNLTRAALKTYFDQSVIRGPGAFSMIAYGYGDYARAMEQKLLRELRPPVLGALEADDAQDISTLHQPKTVVVRTTKGIGTDGHRTRRP